MWGQGKKHASEKIYVLCANTCLCYIIRKYNTQTLFSENSLKNAFSFSSILSQFPYVFSIISHSSWLFASLASFSYTRFIHTHTHTHALYTQFWIRPRDLHVKVYFAFFLAHSHSHSFGSPCSFRKCFQSPVL